MSRNCELAADCPLVMSETAETRPLVAPAEGLPPLHAGQAGLELVAEQISAGSGPIAVDTERASGYRYSQRAYLLQFRRAGSGTLLLDPIEVADFQPLVAALADSEWIIHSATQDLGCLADIGLRPSAVFDTELAAKLLGKPRVGLGALLESELGVSIAKEHSAADWSVRPLPEPWLNYAALDVELLIELRELLVAELAGRGRSQWAVEEFAVLAKWRPAPAAAEPWRRTSGIHRLHKPAQLALVRELWQARDAMARQQDKAPGRLLPDAGLIDIAKLGKNDAREIRRLPTLRHRSHKALAEHWAGVVEAGLAQPASLHPKPAAREAGMPPPKAWPERFPAAADRWQRIRPALNSLATELGIPPEVLISPETIRRLAWEPGSSLASAAELTAHLAVAAARPWQIELCAPVILAAMTGPAPSETAKADSEIVDG